ncbi:hypothetical protein AAC23_002106 [Salmonella enterica subsp. enterica]|nr:hypothetical protein [Salmonella enterica subsp. enterica serovar Rissen]EDR3046659.1 hypothetical protein [Salmonella enterica subsp. enterica serovar Rissen]
MGELGTAVAKTVLYAVQHYQVRMRITEFFIYNELVYFYEPAFTQRPTG